MNIKKSKKLFLLTAGFSGIAVSVSLALTSCSNVLSDYLKKTVSKGDGTSFYDTLTGGSLSDLITNGFDSITAQSNVLNYTSNLIALAIIEKLGEDTENGPTYKNDLTKQKEQIDEDYNDLIDQYKNDYGNAWSLKIQQDVLDPVGGTVEAYKLDKLLSWASTYLNDKIFSQFYATLTDSNGTVIKNPTQQQVLGILAGTSKYSFTDKAIDLYANTLEGQIFSQLQQIIFDNWVKFSNPFIINTSLWKYGTPKDGMNTLYSPATNSSSSSDDEGNTTETKTAGSYSFSYFGNENETNTELGTVNKFVAFVNDSKTKNNYKETITTGTNGSSNYGLKKIDKKYTDDTSTYTLVKNASAYTDLLPENAAAVSYLYGNLKSSDTGVTDSKTKMQKSMHLLQTTGNGTSNQASGFDAITNEFVSTAEFNGIEKQVKLDKSLVNQIFNQQGGLKGNRDKDLYVIDAFIPSDTQLNDFIFVRNSDGVIAISIDGSDYIKTATSFDDMKTKAANVVMYRYFNNIKKYDTDFSVDLQSELTTYYNSNIYQTLISFLYSNKLGINIDLNEFGTTNSDVVKTLLNSMVDVFTLNQSKNKKNDFLKNLYSKKKTYSATNYGQTAASNGLAAPYIYPTATNNGFEYDFVKLALPKYSNKEYSALVTEADTAFNTAKSNYLKTISSTLTSLTSSFEGFKYSQYIYSNVNVANRVINTYASSTNLTDSMITQVLKTNVGSKYNYTANTTYSSKFVSNNTTIDTNLNKGIDQGLSNYFYGSKFTDSEFSRWQFYNQLINTTTKADTNGNITVADLNNYRNKFWTYNTTVLNDSKQSSEKELYSLLVSIDYLIQDNFANFITYLKDNITIGKDAYIVWENSYNKYLEPDATTTKADGSTTTNELTINQLLDTNNIKMNLNNSYQTEYYGKSTDTKTNPIKDNTYADATYNANDNYYFIAGNKKGFYGLQTSTTNTLNTTVSNMLFNNPRSDQYNSTSKGVLYSFVNKDNLINYVNNLTTISDVENFAETLYKNTGSFDKNEITKKGLSLKTKKEIFVNNIKDTNQIKDSYFEARNGDFGLEKVTTTTKATSYTYSPIQDSENNMIYHGGYAIQLNVNNITDFNTFVSYLKTTMSTTDTTNGTDENIYNVIGNLIVKAATDATIQTNAINKIALNNKITVYDKRIYDQLGSTWVKNWIW